MARSHGNRDAAGQADVRADCRSTAGPILVHPGDLTARQGFAEKANLGFVANRGAQQADESFDRTGH
jgi:hypothetical protein